MKPFVELMQQALVDETLDPLRWNGDVSQSDVATQGEQAGMALSLFIPLVLAVGRFLPPSNHPLT